MQQLVRRSIGQVGGYWRPLAGLARLLEELGELAEGLADPASPPGDVASEMADLWIITTAILDQFLGEAEEPGSLPKQSSPAGDQSDQMAELLIVAGQIARIINYYDGPKTPRSDVEWPSLNETILDFHRTLAALARRLDIDLDRAVREKLESIPGLDSGRFERAVHDPSTAPILEGLLTEDGMDPWEWDRAWGAPTWSERSFTSNVEGIVPSLMSLTRAAIRERIEAYVIAPPFRSVERFPEWRSRLLAELADRDPRRAAVGGLHGSRDDVIVFNGLEMSVAVFPALYSDDRSSEHPSGALLVLRPCL